MQNCYVKTCPFVLTDGICITVARKQRCPNLLERSGGTQYPKRCSVDFLPTVVVEDSTVLSTFSPGPNMKTNNLLQCVEVNGFAKCPTKQPSLSSTVVNEYTMPLLTMDGRCKLFQTCDQAVLMSGGWNNIHSTTTSEENIDLIQSSLLRQGFLKQNIKIFNGNTNENEQLKGNNKALASRRVREGNNKNKKYRVSPVIRGIKEEEEGELDNKERSENLSSSMKSKMRSHIRKICELRHCADTFFLYLNNPTNIEGSILLWDIDNNGLVI
jgi:hypothetical protein